MPRIDAFLKLGSAQGCSDVHLAVGVPPMLRMNGDLMPIKSGEFGDNIVSETLVEILVKQGKKDRAIEVLKKLIWKYPQKKAYFASQIQKLQKLT